MRSPSLNWFLLLPLLGMGWVDARAQIAVANPPQEIEDYREAYDKAFAELSAPAREKFAKALHSLETERAAAGDYLGAIRARDRRLELLGRQPGPDSPPNPDPGPAHDEGVIEVSLGAANRTGSGVRFDQRGGKLSGFKEGRSIRWDLNNTEPGEYSVVVTYSCGGLEFTSRGFEQVAGGVFALWQQTNLTIGAPEELRRTVVSTGGWNKTITRNIGKIRAESNRMTLVLTAKKVAPGGLMNLYGLRLVPVTGGRDPVANLGDPTLPPELAALREKFRAAVATKTAGLIAGYGMKLRERREQATEANDLDAALDAQAAYAEAEKISSDPLALIGGIEDRGGGAETETEEPGDPSPSPTETLE